MTKQQENRAFAKMIKEFPKAFGRVSFRERLMLRVAFTYVVEEVIGDIKANYDYVLEGKDLEIKRLEDRIRELWNEKEDLQKENEQLKQQIEKMKCCENCKYNSYWGNELHCNYGLKEALQEDKLVECKDMDKWEIKENG